MFLVLFFLFVVLRNFCFLLSLLKFCDYKELFCMEQILGMVKRRKILFDKQKMMVYFFDIILFVIIYSIIGM